MHNVKNQAQYIVHNSYYEGRQILQYVQNDYKNIQNYEKNYACGCEFKCFLYFVLGNLFCIQETQLSPQTSENANKL